MYKHFTEHLEDTNATEDISSLREKNNYYGNISMDTEKFLEQWRLVHTVKDKHLKETLKNHSTLGTYLMSSMSLAALGRTNIRFQLSSSRF